MLKNLAWQAFQQSPYIPRQLIDFEIKPRTRLKGVPRRQSPAVVKRSVSAAVSMAKNGRPLTVPRSTTVRQIPEQAIDAPTAIELGSSSQVTTSLRKPSDFSSTSRTSPIPLT